MFYVLSGKKIILGLIVINLMILMGITIYAGSTDRETKYDTVIIDAGHGGMDGGAVGLSGTLEKDVNFSIAKKFKELLKKEKIKLVMTRSEDDMLNDDGAKSVKMSDLDNRIKIAGKYKKCIFVSIHMNSFKDSAQHGAQIFYSPNNPDSEKLASIMREEFQSLVDSENQREIKDGGNIYILKNLQVPAVIAECGFISNAEEEKLLNTPEYQDKIANALLNSVKRIMAE